MPNEYFIYYYAPILSKIFMYVYISQDKPGISNLESTSTYAVKCECCIINILL